MFNLIQKTNLIQMCNLIEMLNLIQMFNLIQKFNLNQKFNFIHSLKSKSTKIDYGAFISCDVLTSAHLPDDLETIDKEL